MRRPSKSIGRTRAEVAIDDVSRDVSRGGDRRLWLLESCPACGASPGARCRPPRGASRQPILHVARGWRQRRCPVCQAGPGEACVSPSGRTAAGPHAARRGPARGELSVVEEVWRALERTAATVGRVRFAGGGARRASVEAVAAAAGGGELARWRAGENELGDALAAPVWARYGGFRGQPPITGTLSWSVAERSIMLAGRRGSERFAETLAGAGAIRSGRGVSRDASPVSAVERRACERCGAPIAPSARSEARYCSKRCRQAASRVRLRELWGPPARVALERCAWCEGPMPAGLRLEACYCSKRCRQAASRGRLAEARGRGRGPRADEPTPSDTSRDASRLGNPLSPGPRGRAR
jgi:hypothetical protein